ncbi:MAG: hypothetical protein ACQET3_06655, partial [Promethearchaeati archaeon]
HQDTVPLAVSASVSCPDPDTSCPGTASVPAAFATAGLLSLGLVSSPKLDKSNWTKRTAPDSPRPGEDPRSECEDFCLEDEVFLTAFGAQRVNAHSIMNISSPDKH